MMKINGFNGTNTLRSVECVAQRCDLITKNLELLNRE